MGLGDSRYEGEKTATTEELGDKEGGVALGICAVDPAEARPEDAGLAATLSQNPTPVAAHEVPIIFH